MATANRDSHPVPATPFGVASVREHPWVGASAFATLRSSPTRELVEPTVEERFWRRLLPSLFSPTRRPNWLVRLIHHITVTPLAHVTFFNVEYQIYLNQVLHTSAGAWLGHVICIPLNVMLLFYALCVFTAFGAAGTFALNGGLILLGLLSLWYLGMALRLRSSGWAVGSVLLLLALAAAGNGLAQLTVDPLRHPGWAPTAWYANPLWLILAVSVIQAMSHLFEHHVPPRANFRESWIATKEFLWGDARQLPLSGRLRRLAWTPIGAIWGTLDEWYASAKLLPIYLLQVMWALGYKPDQARLYRDRALRVLDEGNPALDWVGSGGGRYHCDLDPRHTEPVS